MDREQAFQFCGAFAPKQTGGFRPDYVTPHRQRMQDRTFGMAAIRANQLAAETSMKQTRLAAASPLLR
jgi:hypothetical protein